MALYIRMPAKPVGTLPECEDVAEDRKSRDGPGKGQGED